MTLLSTSEIKKFQEKILAWYKENQRDLPWRKIPFDEKVKQRDPYKILVSEVMSQQTQLSRVIPKYEAWLQRFPTVESLDAAPTRDVLLYWSGLGYNRRALSLQKAAKVIAHDYRGIFPRSFDLLRQLPGIGEYTANAIRVFAFNEQVAVVDTNVRKVILLEILKKNLSEQESVRKDDVEAIAQKLLPKGRAYEWNQALMDYASQVLKDKKILVPKQTAFRSSNRYYRGHIMKVLVSQHTVSRSSLWQYFESNNPVERERFEAIIEQLEKDGFLKKEKELLIIV